MIFRKNLDYEKMSFNCDKDNVNKINEMTDILFCNKTAIINEAIRLYYKRFKKEMDRINKKGSY